MASAAPPPLAAASKAKAASKAVAATLNMSRDSEEAAQRQREVDELLRSAPPPANVPHPIADFPCARLALLLGAPPARPASSRTRAT